MEGLATTVMCFASWGEMVTCRVSGLSFTLCIHLMWRALCPLFYLSAVYVRHSTFFLFYLPSRGGHCVLFDSFQKLFRCCDWPFIFRRVRKIAKADYCLRHVCPSARNNSVPTGWIFMTICLRIFRISAEKIQLLLKTDTNSGHFIFRPMYIFDHISLSSSQNEKCSGQICRENQNTHFMFINSPPPAPPALK